MISKVELKELFDGYLDYLNDCETGNADRSECWIRGKSEAFETVPITRVELWRVELWLELRVRLHNDIEVSCRAPRSGWMCPGAFVVHSDIIGKPIDQTWVAGARPSISSFPLNDDDVAEFLLAYRDSEGIVLLNTPRPNGHPEELSDYRESVLAYIHPEATRATTECGLPPQTWDPPIRVEWEEVCEPTEPELEEDELEE